MLTTQLKAIMRQKKISQSTLAQAMGVSRSWISQVLRDDSNLTINTLFRITHLIGCRLKVEHSPSCF
jgi:transcriptional regulator with XRE-family HTH domain